MKNRALAFGLLLGSTALSSPLMAQSINDAVPPERQNLDANYVDRASGGVYFPQPALSIGPSGRGGLSVRGGASSSGSQADNGGSTGGSDTNWGLVIYATGSVYQVGLGQTVETFNKSGSAFTSVDGTGSTLTQSGTAYTYQTSDGTKIVYDNNFKSSYGQPVVARATKIIYATGEQVTLTWVLIGYCSNNQDSCAGGTTLYRVRLQSVSNSNGYQLHYNYHLSDVITPGQGAGWNTLTSISAINLAYDYCDPTAPTCSVSNQTPATMSYSGNTVTDPLGRVTVLTIDPAGGSISVQQPGNSSPNIIYTLSSGIVTNVTRNGHSYAYAQNVNSGIRTVTVTDPVGNTSATTADTTLFVIRSSTDGNGRVTTYTPDSYGRIKQVLAPEGNSTNYNYDTNGNITSTTLYPKTGSGPTNITTSATFPCASAVTCNKPSSTTDANGNVTNYTYDPTSGQLSTITGPAISVNGNNVHTQVRFNYDYYQAYYRNSSGSIVASGVPEQRLSTSSACRTTSNCVKTADETRTTYNWGTQAAGTINNLLLAGITVAAGDGSVSSTTSYGYNPAGDQNSTTDPLGNVTNAIYDLDHEITSLTTPDPDGSGPLHARETLYGYTPLGAVNAVSQGYVGSSGFVDLQNVAAPHDAAGRLLSTSLLSGDNSTTYSLIQYSYDNDDRVLCAATRMNPSAFTSQSDACKQGTLGSFGPDRIQANVYETAIEASGRITSVTNGDGMTLKSITSYGYTPNGQLQTLTDPNGNQTGYVYDSFDRLSKTSYADGSYDQALAYDGNGNETSERLRDGNIVGFKYDALNHLMERDAPGGGSVADPNLIYGYDLANHLIAAGDTSNHLLSFTYDALGRRTAEATVFSGQTSTYDAAGRRTMLKWGDGFYVTYGYDAADEMTGIYENGGTALVTFAYDDLGRRTSRTNANATAASYGYDGASRLNTLALTGTYFPDTITLGNYSPAGEIGTRSQSNDYYAYTQAVSTNSGYTTNGLNQYTKVANVTQAYDGRGNLTSSATGTYAYDSRNELISVAGSTTLYYDPTGRLDTISAESLHLAYDGAQLLTEFNYDGSVARRYVYGPNADEPLVWYEGTGTSDRRFLDADERGSIIRVTQSSGLTINSYDEYGIRSNGNAGRFQYTGQAYIPSAGLYDYKARMYSPGLGRFMQTDPIGYGDGPNWYNYVGGDPINSTDPSGMRVRCAGLEHNVSCSDDGSGGGGGSGGGAGAGYVSGDPKGTRNIQLKLDKKMPQKPNRVDCHSAGRQVSQLTSRISTAFGAGAVAFGGLGAEPVAGALAGAALVADGVGALAGAYVAYSEGDYGPLKSSVIGSVVSAVTGVGVKGLGGQVSFPAPGVMVTKAASDTQAAAASYAAGQGAQNVPAQTCGQSAF